MLLKKQFFPPKQRRQRRQSSPWLKKVGYGALLQNSTNICKNFLRYLPAVMMTKRETNILQIFEGNKHQ